MNVSDDGQGGEDCAAATGGGDPVRIPIRIRHEDNGGGIVPIDDDFAGDAGSETTALLLPAVNQVRETAHRTSGDEASPIEGDFVVRDLTNGDGSTRCTDDVVIDGRIITADNAHGGVRPDASALTSGGNGVAQVDYDDDGDLDLYVINSPSGDNALNRPVAPGDFAAYDASSSFKLSPPAVQDHREPSPPPLLSADETFDEDFTHADTFVFDSRSERTGSASDRGGHLVDIKYHTADLANDRVQADCPEPEANAILIGDGCAILDSAAFDCLI